MVKGIWVWFDIKIINDDFLEFQNIFDIRDSFCNPVSYQSAAILDSHFSTFSFKWSLFANHLPPRCCLLWEQVIVARWKIWEGGCMKRILSKLIKQILGLTISVWTSVIVKYPLLLFWIALLSSALTSQYRAAGILWSQGVGNLINKPSRKPKWSLPWPIQQIPHRLPFLASSFPFHIIPCLLDSGVQRYVFVLLLGTICVKCPWKVAKITMQHRLLTL